MLTGYARVSTIEQDTQAQLDAFKRADVGRVFQEQRSGVAKRPELEKLLDQLRAGDTLVVWKLDRLARSLADLLRILARVEAAGASFRSLTETIDTSTPAGRMLMQILGAFAEFERGMIRERSIAGQEAARDRGAILGRPRAMTAHQEHQMAVKFGTGDYSKNVLAKMFGCSVSSIKRALARVGLDTVSERHSNGCYIPPAGRQARGRRRAAAEAPPTLGPHDPLRSSDLQLAYGKPETRPVTGRVVRKKARSGRARGQAVRIPVRESNPPESGGA